MHFGKDQESPESKSNSKLSNYSIEHKIKNLINK